MKSIEREVSTGAVGDVPGSAARGHDSKDEGPREKFVPRTLDDVKVDFDDAREFYAVRWGDVLQTTTAKLTASDLQVASECRDWQVLAAEIQAKITESLPRLAITVQMSRIKPLSWSLLELTTTFSNLVMPSKINHEKLCGLIYLILKLSYVSSRRLQHTINILGTIQSLVNLFNRCLENYNGPINARQGVVDFLEPLTVIILTDSISYMHEHSSDRYADQNWAGLKEKINDQLRSMEAIVKHVNEISMRAQAQQRLSQQQYATIIDPVDTGTFPKRVIPFQQNPEFYGRKQELEKIFNDLKPKKDQSFRTYTIYGRRGVGKTEIALQFAHTNPTNYDAIFWVQCETSVAIRQSFTNIALALDLPGAVRDGHHEENHLAVKWWLKYTDKRWLLVFDNAERPEILQPYWPTGSSGDIILTSRENHNFTNDARTKGGTLNVQPFDAKQSWELLLQFLGNDWKRMDRENKIPSSEVKAASAWLERLDGVSLAIQQAANLIKDPDVGGTTIAQTLEVFDERSRNTRGRNSKDGSDLARALDTLWDMSWSRLSTKSKNLLGVLAWMSPDKIPVDLYLPGSRTTTRWDRWDSETSHQTPHTGRRIKGKIKGRDVWAFGDTGAGQNIIAAHHAKELGLEIHKSPRRLRMGNSRTIVSPGIVKYPWAFSENPYKITNIVAHVLDGFSHDLLLGNPFLKATQTMTKHISRFVKGVFSTHHKWSLNLLGDTSHRLEGVLRGNVRMQGLPDIGSTHNMMNEDWAKAHGFSIQAGSANCGVVHFPDGTTAPTTGRIHTTITLAGGDAVPIVFNVLPDCYVPVILGEDFVFDNNIFSNYADSLHEVEGLDCCDDLLLMDYQQPWYATIAEKAKLLLRPKLWKHKTTKELQPEKVLNDVIELERQHHWDVKYQYGKEASRTEWDAEHDRRETHELRKYPHWRLGPNQTLIKHEPQVTISYQKTMADHSHDYVMFGANEAALWRAERPSRML